MTKAEFDDITEQADKTARKISAFIGYLKKLKENQSTK